MNGERRTQPAPGRLRAAARLVVALLLGSLVVLGFHLPHGHWMAMTVIVVSLPNAGASLQKAVERALGTLVAGAVTVLAIAACQSDSDVTSSRSVSVSDSMSAACVFRPSTSISERRGSPGLGATMIGRQAIHS